MKIDRFAVVFLGALVPLLLSAQEPGKAEKLQWTQLGMTAQINNDFFSHVFRIPKRAEVFSKLELRINGIFRLDLIVVEYEDRTTWSPKEYPAIPIRKSYPIALPDSGKKIKTVEIRYHDVGGPINTAAVDLWGGRAKR